MNLKYQTIKHQISDTRYQISHTSTDLDIQGYPPAAPAGHRPAAASPLPPRAGLCLIGATHNEP